MSGVAARLATFLFVGVLCAIGPLLLLIALVSAIPTLQFVRAGLTTDGAIIDLQRTRSIRTDGYVSKPMFRFTADDGNFYLGLADFDVGPSHFTIGDRVPIIYLKGHPERARINTISQLWLKQIILAVAGCALSFIPFLIIKRKLSNHPTQTSPYSL